MANLSFNRTIVELKLAFAIIADTNLSLSFNRTIVELKLLKDFMDVLKDYGLLIVP